jgi:hypothetical protein
MRIRLGTPEVSPTAAEIERVAGQIRSARGHAERFTTILTPSGRKQTRKFRMGGQSLVGILTQLAEERGFQLENVPVSQMGDSLARAERIQQLLNAVTSFRRELADSVLKARSDCWRAVTAYYGAFNGLALSDPKLKEALRPATAFFARGPRKGNGGPPPTNKPNGGR